MRFMDEAVELTSWFDSAETTEVRSEITWQFACFFAPE